MQVGRAGLSSPGFTFQPAGLHKHSTPGQVGKGHFNSVHEIRGEVKCQLCYCTSLLTSCPRLKKTGMVGAGKQYASFSKISCIQDFSSWTVPFNHAHLTPSSCFLSSLMSQIRTKTILNSSTQLGYEFRRFACVVQCANQIVQSPNIISGISPGNLDQKRGLYLFRL